MIGTIKIYKTNMIFGEKNDSVFTFRINDYWYVFYVVVFFHSLLLWGVLDLKS